MEKIIYCSAGKYVQERTQLLLEGGYKVKIITPLYASTEGEGGCIIVLTK